MSNMDNQNISIENTEAWIHCVEDRAFIIFSYVLFAVIWFPTVFGNLLIIVSIAKFRHLRSNMHILIGNLAISDLLIGVSIILQVISNFAKDLAVDKYFCLGQNAVFVMSLGTSSLNLLAISIERFVAVKYPLKHRLKFTRNTTKTLICVCWGYYTVVAWLPLMGWNDFKGDVPICDTDLVWTKAYDVVIFGGLLIILAVNGVLVGFVIKIISANSHSLRYIPSSSFRILNAMGNLRRTKMMLIVFGVFGLCWAPYLIVSLEMVFYDKPEVRCARQWCTCTGIVNSALNWIIYGLANRNFREAFQAVLKRQTIVQLRGSVKR